MGSVEYIALLKNYTGHFTSNALNSKDWSKELQYIGNDTVLQVLAFLVSRTGGIFIIFLALAWFEIYSPKRRHIVSQELHNNVRYVEQALIMGSWLHATWWIMYSTAGARYAMPLFFYLPVAICLRIAITSLVDPKNDNWRLPIYVGLFLFGKVPALTYLIDLNRNTKTYVDEMQLITRKLTELEQREHAQLFSCGNNFELEYLIQGSRHFRECHELSTFQAHNPDIPTYLVYFKSIDSAKLAGKTLYISAYDHFGHFIDLPPNIDQQCRQLLISSSQFTINKCSGPLAK